MKSKASVLGHPLHTILVGIPIGLLVWTLIADFVYLGSDKNVVWYDIAYWTGFAAWISALVAALPGAIDLLTLALKTDAHDIGIAHGLANVIIAVLFIVATVVMWDHGALNGNNLTLVIVLHAVGVGLLALSGWLGGEMVYRHHLGMMPDDAELERAEQARHVTAGPNLGTR